MSTYHPNLDVAERYELAVRSALHYKHLLETVPSDFHREQWDYCAGQVHAQAAAVEQERAVAAGAFDDLHGKNLAALGLGRAS